MGGRNRIAVENRKREGVKEQGRKERGEGGHKGSPGRSQSALCKQASSWSGQVVGGGVLHGPLRLSAEQITDGRNVAFVLKRGRAGGREGTGGGGGVQRVAESGATN